MKKGVRLHFGSKCNLTPFSFHQPLQRGIRHRHPGVADREAIDDELAPLRLRPRGPAPGGGAPALDVRLDVALDRVEVGGLVARSRAARGAAKPAGLPMSRFLSVPRPSRTDSFTSSTSTLAPITFGP